MYKPEKMRNGRFMGKPPYTLHIVNQYAERHGKKELGKTEQPTVGYRDVEMFSGLQNEGENKRINNP